MSLKITIVVMLWKAFMWHILFKDGTFANRDIDPSFPDSLVESRRSK